MSAPDVSCPEETELLALLDGEATENRASVLRAHATSCSRCGPHLAALEALARDLAAPPVLAATTARAIAGLGARMDAAAAADVTPLRTPAQRARVLAAWGAGLAAAAALVVLVEPALRSAPPRGTFTARGGSAGTAAAASGASVTVYRLDARLVALAPGEHLPPSTPFTVGVRNEGVADAWVMTVAIDTRGELHWIDPGWTDPATDPEAVLVPPQAGERARPETVVLEAPAPGALRLVTLIARRPLRVSDVERVPVAERTRSGLAARFPDVVIDELTVELIPGGVP